MTDTFTDRGTDNLLDARDIVFKDLEDNGDRPMEDGGEFANVGNVLEGLEGELSGRGVSPLATEEPTEELVGEDLLDGGDAIDRFLDGETEGLGGPTGPEPAKDSIDIFLDGGELPESFLNSDDPQIQRLIKRQEALERSFTESMGVRGAMEERGFFNAAREIEKLAKLRGQGVDIEGGFADFSLRLEQAFIRRNENLEIFFTENFEDYRQTEVGTVVTVRGEDGILREILFDETGLSLGDIADAAPELLDVIAAVAGGTAVAVSGGVSVLLIAAGAAAAEFVTGTATETIATMRNGGMDEKVFSEIVIAQGTDAGINYALDVFLAGGGRLIRFASGPFGKQIRTDPAAAIKAAKERLSEVLGRPLRLTPGTETQSETLMRAEAFVSKVPGSAGLARTAKEQEEADLAGIVDDLIGRRMSGQEFGDQISRVLTRERGIAVEGVEDSRRAAELMTNQRIKEIEQTMTTRPLSYNESGELARRNIERARDKFKSDQGALSNRSTALINQLPDEKQAFASTAGLKNQAKKLENQFPKETKVTPIIDDGEVIGEEVTRETIVRLFPTLSRKLLLGVQQLDDNVTVQELRNVRSGISLMIQNATAFPGVNVGMVKKLETELTKAIRNAADNAPNAEIRAALIAELDHFKNGVGVFQTRPVASALKREDQSGFKEGEDVLPSLFVRDRPEDIERVLNVIGADSIAARAAKRSAFSKILRDSSDPVLGDNVADPIAVLKKIEGMSEKTQQLLFSGQQERVKELFRLSAARYGTLDMSLLKTTKGNADILDILEGALQNEVAARRIFDNKIFKRILANEIDVTQMRPDQFVRYTLREANPLEIDELFRILNIQDAKLAGEFRVQTIAHILGKADTQSADVLQAIARIDGKITPSEGMDNVLRQFAEDPKDSIEKLELILGADQLQILKDMSLIQAARSQKSSAAAAAGGLIGGSVLSNLIGFNRSGIFQVAKYRIVGELLNYAPTRAWLRSPGIPALSREKIVGKITRADMVRIGGVALPEFVNLMAQTYGEFSEEVKLARFIEENLETLVP